MSKRRTEQSVLLFFCGNGRQDAEKRFPFCSGSGNKHLPEEDEPHSAL